MLIGCGPSGGCTLVRKRSAAQQMVCSAATDFGFLKPESECATRHFLYLKYHFLSLPLPLPLNLPLPRLSLCSCLLVFILSLSALPDRTRTCTRTFRSMAYECACIGRTRVVTVYSNIPYVHVQYKYSRVQVASSERSMYYDVM